MLATRVKFLGLLAKITFAIVCLAAMWILGSWYARTTHATDFPVYYNAAQFIFSYGEPFQDLFRRPMASLYPLPEIANDGPYNYSPISVFLFFPLLAFDYLTAKTIFFALSVIGFLTSVKILLSIIRCPPQDHIFILLPSLLWGPFLDDLRFFQVNSILLMFVVFGLWAISRGRDAVGAAFMALATVLKIYPLLLLLSLIPRHRNALIYLIVLSALAFLVPGTWNWLTGIEDRINHEALNPIYTLQFLQNPIISLPLIIGLAGIHFYGLEKLGIHAAHDRFALAATFLFLSSKYYQIFNLVILIIPVVVALRILKNRIIRAVMMSLFSFPIYLEIGQGGFRWSIFTVISVYIVMLGVLIYEFFLQRRRLNTFDVT